MEPWELVDWITQDSIRIDDLKRAQSWCSSILTERYPALNKYQRVMDYSILSEEVLNSFTQEGIEAHYKKVLALAIAEFGETMEIEPADKPYPMLGIDEVHARAKGISVEEARAQIFGFGVGEV